MFNWLKFFLITTAAFFVIMTAYFFYLMGPISFADASPTGQTLIVGAGTGFTQIAQMLRDQNLIRSGTAFKLYSIFSGSAHMLKAGTYIFTSALSVPEIMKNLVNGPQDIPVLISEGKTLREIDQQLTKLDLLAPGSVASFPIRTLTADYPFLRGVKTLEGFLFPDTYRIAPGSTAEAIIRKFLDNFKNKVLPELLAGRNFQNADYQTLIAASFIEKEIPPNSDRFLVAGIIGKRLKIGMALQIDATVAYAKCQILPEGQNCQPLTKADYKLKSAYNTYFYQGLTPAPISNPGLNAIIAANHPKASDFLYYLSDPATQKTVFSKTLEEHNVNRVKYLHL